MRRGAMKFKRTKGQIALETMIVIGFVLALLAPLLYMLYTRVTEMQQEMLMLEATRSVDTIATTVASLGVIGPNGTATFEVTFPANMKSLTIGGSTQREIVMVVSTILGEVDIPRVSYFNMTVSDPGQILNRTGKHRIIATYPENGVITLSPA